MRAARALRCGPRAAGADSRVRARSDRELLAGSGRKHSNLDDAEYNFYVFSKVRGGVLLARLRSGGADATPRQQLEYDRRDAAGTLPGEAYFARKAFDPAFMRELGPWTPPPPLGQGA